MGCAHRLQEVIMKRIQDIIEEQIKNAFVGAGSVSYTHLTLPTKA